MTAEWHIGEDLFVRFLRAEASKQEGRMVVRHLLSRCDQCSEMAHRVTAEAGLWGGKAGKAGWEQAYEEVVQRAFAFVDQEEQRLALERVRGWALWTSLAPLASRVRFATVDADPAYHNFGLYQRLLEASRRHLHRDPVEAMDIVGLAILVAERLDAATIGKERIADLRAAAWAALGNARRVAESFDGARRAFNEAWRILEEEGTADPLEAAYITSLEASYMKDIGEFETAEAALEEALEAYRKARDPHLQGRTLLKMGETIGYVNPERGIAHIEKALALLDLAKEPRLDLCAQHALAGFLANSGRPEEALVVLDRARPLYQQFRDDFSQLRLHWLEGKIAHRLGELAEAESIFTQTWKDFRARNLQQEVVLVTIELAQVLVEKGEPARAAELASQAYAVMNDWGLHKFALAAWIVFQDALDRGRAAGDVFRRIEEYYRRHWVRPGSFEL
ncbi:MAG TPA: hypothetical protein VF756_07560 [Thermoanaerobaculia bacterium]